MSKTQTPKHEFPKDWSKITDAEVVSELIYLIEHIQEYKIQQIDKETIVIDDVIKMIKNPTYCYIGNMVKFGFLGSAHQVISGSAAFCLFNGLFDKCEQQINHEKKQQKKGQQAEKRDKIARIGVAVFITGIFMAGTWFIAGQIHNVEKMLDDKADRINKTEKRIEQKIKELEMIKTANTKDSVQNIYQ